MISFILDLIIENSELSNSPKYAYAMHQFITKITVERAITVFYGSYVLAYFFAFRGFLFSLQTHIEGKVSKKKLKKMMRLFKHDFEKEHPFLAWLLLKNGFVQECECFYPRISKICVVYNYVSLAILLMGTIFLICSVVLPFFYQFFLDMMFIYVVFIFIPTEICQFAFRIAYRNVKTL